MMKKRLLRPIVRRKVIDYDIQGRVVELREQVGDTYLLPSPVHALLFLVSEVGEICDAVLRLEGTPYLRNRKAGDTLRQDLVMEIGDALLMLSTLATQHEVDLNEALTLSIEKARKRVQG